MSDVLASGPDRPPRRVPPLLLALVALVAAAVGVPWLLASRGGAADVDSADAAPASTASPTPPERSSARLPLAPRGTFAVSDHVLLAGADQVLRLDLADGATSVLRPPMAEVRPGPGRLLAADPDVAVFTFREGDERGAGPIVFAFPPASPAAEFVGFGARVVPTALGSGVWLDPDGGRGSSVRAYAWSGDRPLGRAVPLGAGEALVADLFRGLLVAPASGRPGPVLVRDHATGAVVDLVAGSGVVLDARGRLVLWAPCRGCDPAVTELPSGRQRSLRTGAVSDVIDARLSPDGRHVALLVRRAWAAAGGIWDVAVAHLPGDARDGSVSTALSGLRASGLSGGRPQLGYTAAGELVVSDGQRLYVVRGGPHVAYAVPWPVPSHTDLAVGSQPVRR